MNQPQQPFSTDFQWTPPVNVDGEFALSAFYEAPAGQHLEIFSRKAIPGMARYGRQTHPEFSVLCRYPANYINIAGRFVAWWRWEAEQDAGVRYLTEHLDTAPIPNPDLLLEPLKFDWKTRTISYRHDLDRIPEKTWVRNDYEWYFDMVARFESLGGLSRACILSERLYDWKNYIYRLPKGHEVSVPRESGKRTYLIALDGEATLTTQKGSVPMPRLQGFRLTTSGVSVRASVPTTVLRRVRDEP